MPKLSAEPTGARPLEPRAPLLRGIAVVILIVPMLVVVGVMICAISARSQLSLLQRQPVAQCPSTGTLPPRALATIEQKEMDHELVRHLARKHDTKNRYAFILRRNLYDLALPMVHSPSERRSLFVRLPCDARPRLFKWRHLNAAK